MTTPAMTYTTPVILPPKAATISAIHILFRHYYLPAQMDLPPHSLKAMLPVPLHALISDFDAVILGAAVPSISFKYTSQA